MISIAISILMKCGELKAVQFSTELFFPTGEFARCIFDRTASMERIQPRSFSVEIGRDLST